MFFFYTFSVFCDKASHKWQWRLFFSHTIQPSEFKSELSRLEYSKSIIWLAVTTSRWKSELLCLWEKLHCSNICTDNLFVCIHSDSLYLLFISWVACPLPGHQAGLEAPLGDDFTWSVVLLDPHSSHMFNKMYLYQMNFVNLLSPSIPPDHKPCPPTSRSQ